MQILLSALELTLAVLAVLAVVRRHRKALREHPPLGYEPGPVAWRWANPPAGLTVRESDQVSVLILPRAHRMGAVAAELSAYGFGLLLVASSIATVVNDHPLMVHLLVFVLIGPLIPACLLASTRLERIELRPTTVTFVERGGIWWRRHRTRRRPLKVEGKMDSVFNTHRKQEPRHEIRLRGRMLDDRFRSECDQTMGTWIVGGLQAWSQSNPD